MARQKPVRLLSSRGFLVSANRDPLQLRECAPPYPCRECRLERARHGRCNESAEGTLVSRKRDCYGTPEQQMRTRTLLLLGTVALIAPACAGRLRSGTVSLSPGETVWMSGQAPAANGQQIQTRPGAKSANASRALQNRGRGEQRAATTPGPRSAPSGIAGLCAAPEPTGTVGASAAVAPPASAMSGERAAAAPAARSAVQD